MEMLTKRVATVFIDSSERVINSFYRDKGNPLDPISKRHLRVTCQTLNEAKLTGNMKGSPCMHRKLVRKTKMDKTHRPHLDLHWDLYTVQQTQNNLSQQLNSEEVEFAKIKPFGGMRIRPGCEELRRDFLFSDCSKKDELHAKKVQDSAHGKNTTNFI